MAYYEAHADQFAADTANFDMTNFYEAFLALVPAGGHILDAGCGPGRDTGAFVRMGYRVTAFDASPAMAKLAGERTRLAVRVLRFQDVEFDAEFDGVWACASLLHVPQAEMAAVFDRMVRALRRGGVLYASFKQGEGEVDRGERRFTDYTAAGLRALLASHPLLDVLCVWETADVRPGRERERWVNALARRQKSA